MEDRNLSLSTVAGSLGVSERTVRRWIKSGKLRAYKPGRDYRIPESALRELVEESEISPKAQAPPSPEQPNFNGLFEEERRAAEYQQWVDFVGRFAWRWDRRIETGNFDRGNVDELFALLGDVQPTLIVLGLQEKREHQRLGEYDYPYGPTIGKAIDRILYLFEGLMPALGAKFDYSELEEAQRKQLEQQDAFEEAAVRESSESA